MARFSRYNGKAPEDLLGLADGPPKVILTMLHDFLYPRYIEECRVPLLTAETDVGVPLRTMGAAHKGDWYPLRRGKARKAPLIIHWPTLIRYIPEILPTTPSMGLVLWMFKELFFRKSYFVGETLQRKLLRNVCMFYPGVSMKDYPRLTGEEEVLLSAWLEKLATDQEFLYSLRTSFDWVVGESLSAKTTNRCLVGYPSGHGHKGRDCSVLYLGHVPTHVDSLPLKVVMQDVDSPSYARADMRGLLYELIYASRMPTKLVGHSNRYIPEKFGVLVATRKYQGRTKRILAVNFARFYPHRESYSIHRYAAAYPKYEKHFTAPGDVVLFLASYVEDRYTTLRLPWSTYEFKDAFFGSGKFWDNQEEWASTVFVDADALKDLAIKDRQRYEMVRGVPKKTIRRGKGWRVRVYEDQYVIPNTFDSYSFRMIFHRGDILFTSPWEIPDTERKVPRRQYKGSNTFKCTEGANYFESLDEWFYTLTFLKFSPSFLGSSVPGLLDWLDGFEKLNHRQFHALFKKDRPRSKHPHAFTDMEDRAIIDRYRPGMTEEEMDQLITLCNNRTTQAISNRARVLRNQLIASGVYDVSKLPHRQHNSRLLRQIKEEKAKANWVREKKDAE